MSYVNIKAMRKLEKLRKLKSQVHPYHDLSIWNYEEFVHYEDTWCPITLMCRALVIETDSQMIVGRALPKFFNHNESPVSAPIPEHTSDYRVFDKLDGSLFILFNYKNEWIYCSRGSFTSEQAKQGELILKECFPQHVDLDKKLTYVFELIYPEGRIVVDYGNERTVKFLTAYETDGTEHLILDEMLDKGFNVVKEHDFRDKSLTELCELNIPNHEGYVIRYSNGSRVKVKFDDYIKLHKVRTNFSNKTIFDKWVKKIPIEDALIDIPDEFNEWFRTGIDELNKRREEIISESHIFFNDNMNLERKDFYKVIEKHHFKNIISLIYNGKNPEYIQEAVTRSMTMKDIKTKGLTPSWKVNKTKKVGTAYFLIGCSGSGKSTWCEKFMRNRRDVIRVSRDAIRNALYVIPDSRASADYYRNKDLTSREDVVTSICKKIANDAFALGKTVIFDNTNVNFETLKNTVVNLPSEVVVRFEIFDPFSSEYQDFSGLCSDEVLEKLYQRTVTRGMEIPKKIISKQIKNMIETFSRLDELKSLKGNNSIVQDTNLPKATIFDIDGTLAHCGDRNVYDMSKVDEDTPANHIVDIAKCLYESGMKIILCSGREEKARHLTVKWMDKHGVKYEELHFRPNKDFRKDYIVKEEMWRDLVKRYNIVHMFDDRDQVVNHARSLGFKVSQVAEGNF